MLSLAPFFDLVITFKNPGGAEEARKMITRQEKPVFTFAPELHDQIVKLQSLTKERKPVGFHADEKE